MVVLEGGGMLSTPGNQYIQPDYLSPLPTTLDAKKSPLALLAQTCSQIGADTPTSKPLISPLDKSGGKSKSSDGATRGSPGKGGEKVAARSSPVEVKLAFKPYEANVVSRQREEPRPPSKAGSAHGSPDAAAASASTAATLSAEDSVGKQQQRSESRAPSRKSSHSPAASSAPTPDNGKSTPSATGGSSSSGDRKSTSPSSSAARGASPIIRSGLEMLHGHPKDVPLGTYKASAAALSAGLGLCCPPGLEHAAANPAFRPPFPGGPFSHHHAAMLAAAGGYHHQAAAAAAAAPGPYVSYARVKTPSGGEALVPVCKDPYCAGCQFSVHGQQLLGASPGGPCPSGCTQCDHQKYGLAMAMSLAGGPPSSLAYPHPQLGRPYVCNWIAGDTYCGKRFGTSDELLQHLRTHTSLAQAGSEAAAAAAAAAAACATSTASALLSPHSLFSTAALHRAASGYPNPPLSPLSAAARYHPYAKPALPGSLAASPYSAFNPTALGPYYSPYSVYGQRLGAAVHP